MKLAALENEWLTQDNSALRMGSMRGVMRVSRIACCNTLVLRDGGRQVLHSLMSGLLNGGPNRSWAPPSMRTLHSLMSGLLNGGWRAEDIAAMHAACIR